MKFHNLVKKIKIKGKKINIKLGTEKEKKISYFNLVMGPN